MRSRNRPRYRERASRRRRWPRFVVAVLAVVLGVFAGKTLVHDVRVGHTLSHRGVATTGQLVDRGCLVCRAVNVHFTTAAGVSVTAAVSAIGKQADTTIALRYDPQHPTAVQPAHGVREEEAIAAILLLIAVIVCLRCIGLLRRRGRRRSRVRTRGGSSRDMGGHVRLSGR